MADEVDCVRSSKMFSNATIKAPQPDLVNCAERSILAKQKGETENNCKGIFGDAIVCNKSGTFKTSRFNMFVEGQGGKLRKRSEPLKAVIRPKFVKSASIARLLGNNYSTATTNHIKNSTTTGTATQQGQVEERNEDDAKKVVVGESQVENKRNVNGRRREKFQKCDEQNEEEEENDGCTDDHERKVSFSTVECAADELSLRGSHLNLMSHNSDIRTLRAIRSLTKGIGKLLRRRTDSVDISPPDPEYKVSYLGNVLTGWAKGKRHLPVLTAFVWGKCICFCRKGKVLCLIMGCVVSDANDCKVYNEFTFTSSRYPLLTMLMHTSIALEFLLDLLVLLHHLYHNSEVADISPTPSMPQKKYFAHKAGNGWMLRVISTGGKL